MVDLYDTTGPVLHNGRSRSVVGGVYMKMLTAQQLWGKWAEQPNKNETGTGDDSRSPVDSKQ